MSNAKPNRALVRESSSTSFARISTPSFDGAMKTPCALNTPDSTSNSDGRHLSSGATPPNPAPARLALQASLAQRVSTPDYIARVHEVVEQIPTACDLGALTSLLSAGVQALGAERGVFYSAERSYAGLVNCRLVLACGSSVEPAWVHRYLQSQGPGDDPWLSYAFAQTEPVVASRLHVMDPKAERLIAWARSNGFDSTALVPAHSGLDRDRVSLLCLGSDHPEYFEGPGFDRLRLCARNLAAELHAWWLGQLRTEVITNARLRSVDLALLRMEWQGYSTEAMSQKLRVSKASIYSRFRRMASRLGLHRRQDLTKLAAERGLLHLSNAALQESVELPMPIPMRPQAAEKSDSAPESQ